MNINISITFTDGDFVGSDKTKNDLFHAILNALKSGNVQIGGSPIKEHNVAKKPDRRKTMKLTPDEVLDLVLEYEDQVRRGKLGSGAIKAALAKCKIKVTMMTAQRALFEHADIPGYEDIPTPVRTYSRDAGNNLQVRYMVEEIKYLRDVKKQTLKRIIELTGDEPRFTERVFYNRTYSNIMLTPENTKIFDEKYKNL